MRGAISNLRFEMRNIRCTFVFPQEEAGMTYERFEDLPVWQEAIRLAEGCEDFLLAAKDRITFSKRDRLDRCSLSVSNNIA